MKLLRGAIAAIGLLFAFVIVWTILNGDFSSAATWLTSDPWGITTLFDLYFGFFLIAIVIAFFERSLRAVFWIIPIPFLGNVWVCIWFFYRLNEMARRLAPQKS